VTLSSESLTYDGSNIMPSIISVVLTMTYSNTDYTTRIPSEDYLAIYPTSSKNVGNYSIEIKGQRKCTGTITKNYRIKYPPSTTTPTDLSDCTVGNNFKKYTGSDIDPSSYITVTKGNTTLTSGTDYTLALNSDYSYKEAGIYYNAITITGKGDYTGTKIANFTIYKEFNGDHTSDFTIDPIPTQIYNGSAAVRPTVSVYDNGNQQGFEGTDYQWEYVNIHPFTANIVLNTRQLTAGQHYTACLPYPLPLTDGLKGYTLSASSSQLLGFKEVTGTLEAFHPYIVVAETSGQMLCAKDVTVPVTTGITDYTKLNGQTAGNYTLGGSLRYMSGASAQSLYIMQSGNTWKRIDTSTGSYGGTCILPMRAYIKSSSTSPAPPRLNMSFTNADGTTDIRNVLLNEDDAPILYDLLGRRIQHPGKGIYIHKGQKVVR
jgi:hypothetical protein